MELVLKSTKYDAVTTEGELSVDGSFNCYTLELPYTSGLSGSAISAGRYQVLLAPSPKFMRSDDPWVEQYAQKIPRLMNVPNRSGILIHWGNEARDTEGCILVGQTQGADFIGSSRNAFAALYELIKGPAAAGQCYITICRDTAEPSVAA